MKASDEVDDGDKENIESFLAWLEQQGGKLCPSFYYAQDSVMGLSIFTSSELEAEIEAIYVPKECCITADTARHRILTLLEQDKRSNLLTGKEWVVLYLFLHRLAFQSTSPVVFQSSPSRKRPRVEETSLNSHLMHLPYIRLLPKETITPLHFNKTEVKLLKSTPLYGHAIESRRNGRSSFTKAVSWVLSSLKGLPTRDWAEHLLQTLEMPKNKLPDLEEEETFSLDDEVERWGDDERQCEILSDWRWAETAYGSRAFPPRLLGEESVASAKLSAPILIPGLDAFNHSRQAKVTWTYHDAPLQHITLTLHQKLDKGDQVFNSYGPKSNEDLLASYGFVNKGMEDDTLTLKLGGHHGKIGQQHYWRYNQACPTSLLEEIRSVLRQNRSSLDNDDTDDPSEPPTKLLEEGEAMDTIVSLLEQKVAAFTVAQREVDRVLNQSTAPVRDSVRYTITIYRQSQSRILHSALSRAQSDLDAIEQSLDAQSTTTS